MKIGAFAKRFDVSVDTVRYYMELGLLLPDKKASAHMTLLLRVLTI
ncbi:MerR family DNA-binding transcriptional regulator [Paenibacillus oleatilyticus]|nr:MerR family DNA-binding transcriptional regulator [Paenibacillus oleatilyticus]MBU7314963.1 MerR family DNA-binding transcriptional regulator [Paenibacillus oleatilyticus]